MKIIADPNPVKPRTDAARTAAAATKSHLGSDKTPVTDTSNNDTLSHRVGGGGAIVTYYK
jgi:hypothetical protein